MDRARATVLLVALLATGCVSPPIAVADRFPSATGTKLPGGERVSPPSGFISFCIREPSQCAADASAGPIHLDEETWTLLQNVDSDANSSTMPATDKANYGIFEYWTIVRNGFGDCEDIAATKCALLHQAGFPLHDLRLALVLTEDGARHVVLTAATDRGDLVLDSLNPAILPWEQTHYRWLMRQDGGSIGWLAIRGTSKRQRGARV